MVCHIILLVHTSIIVMPHYYYMWSPVSVAARSKAWVCGHSLAGIAGLNPAGSMDVCLL